MQSPLEQALLAKAELTADLRTENALLRAQLHRVTGTPPSLQQHSQQPASAELAAAQEVSLAAVIAEVHCPRAIKLMIT